MTQHTTIADVAKAAGVSATTVSRIINGRYDKMRPATRKRVEKAIKDLRLRRLQPRDDGLQGGPEVQRERPRQEVSLLHDSFAKLIVTLLESSLEIFLTPFHLYSPKGSMMFYNRQAMISSS